MHNPSPGESRKEKTFRSDQLKKETVSIWTVSMFVHLVIVILKEKQGEDTALGDHLFFQSTGKTWDLLTWNSSKNEKQVQRQCPWQQLKADVSGKGEARTQHTPVSLPEPQHHRQQGWIWALSQMLPCCTAASAVWYSKISLIRTGLCALLLPKAICRQRKDTPRDLITSSSVHKRMHQSNEEAGREARQVNYSLVKRSIGKKEREESNQTPKAESASAPPQAKENRAGTPEICR